MPRHLAKPSGADCSRAVGRLSNKVTRTNHDSLGLVRRNKDASLRMLVMVFGMIVGLTCPAHLLARPRRSARDTGIASVKDELPKNSFIDLQ